MSKIFFISGPCGCGKTTFSNLFARRLVNASGRPVYIIHGDDFHQGFIEPEDKGEFFVDGKASDSAKWEDILRFNWGCILETAGRALEEGLDVVIDYVIEDELPRVIALSEKFSAELYYIVLTADSSEIEKRILERGDTDMTERAIFLKRKLEAMPENRGRLYNNTGKSPEQSVKEVEAALEKFRVIY